jgi:hypothetical protein
MRINPESSMKLSEAVVRHFGSWAAAREHAVRQPDGTLLIRLPAGAGPAAAPTPEAVAGHA